MQKVLDPPNASFGFRGRSGGPRRELLGDGADVRPVTGPSKLGYVAGDGAEGGDLQRVEKGGDANVAVSFEGFEKMGWAVGAGGFQGAGSRGGG